ncbi:putative integral membrane protein [Acanthocheilonema viteae]
MSISFVEKLLLAFAALNLTIIVLLYRYATTDTPITLIIQLMIPLIIWQIILAISFFPDEFIAQFLNDFYGHNDIAAGDQLSNEPPLSNFIESIHSHGDVPQSPNFFILDEQMSFSILF